MISIVLNGILVVFFVLGGLINAAAPGPIHREFARWGFPGWFHWIVAVVELVAAALMILPMSRLAGYGMGACAMLGATVVVVHHREYLHALMPATVLGIIMLAFALR